MKTGKAQGGVVVGIIVTIVVLAVIGAIVAGTSGGGDGGGNTGGDDIGGICHSYCLGLVQLECGSNVAVGACFGAWDCSPPDKGAHECKDSDGY
ncbi:MAG: hypothetical protein EP334_09500 [Gammaproteobacteria bacterium]|nr:MAG: hypothetical protein EP334_09500 [Gammaproteobacteria bacterium]